jgi:hypothetical protein
MARKLALLGVLGALLVVALMLGGQTRHAQADDPLLQIFNMDITQCMKDALTGPPVDPPLAGGVGRINCALNEPKAVAARTDQPLDVALPAGDRIGIPFYYAGPGWTHVGWPAVGLPCNDNIDNDLDGLIDLNDPDCPVAAVPTEGGALTGDVLVVTDLLCNGVADLLAAAGATGPPYTPEVFREQTILWRNDSGLNGASELFLNTLLPGSAAMTPWWRQRADLTTLYLDYLGPTPGVLTLPTLQSLNSVTLRPNWPTPAWAGVPTAAANPLKATTVILGGDPAAPAALFFTCRDTPQDSLSHTFGNVVGNPPAGSPPGLYVRWATELSEPDHNSRMRSIALTTNCKAIGLAPGAWIQDLDSDCLQDVTSTTLPDENEFTGPDCPAGHTDAALWDSDGDGLPDGVEAAWGSDPCKKDTDADGRTDLEEMIGPAEFLTSPVNPDTDGDTVPDGGYKVGAADLDGDGAADAGREVQVSGWSLEPNGKCANVPVPASFPCWSGDGSSHTREAYDIVGTDISADNASSVTVMREEAGASADDVEITLTRNPAQVHIGLVTAGNAAIDCPVLNGVMTASTPTTETWTVKWPAPCDVLEGQSIDIKVFWYHETLYPDAVPVLSGITWTGHMGEEPDPNAPLPKTITRTVPGVSAEDVQITLLRDPLLTKITGVTAGNAAIPPNCPVRSGVKVASGPNTETWWVLWPPPCDVMPGHTIDIAAVSTGPAPFLVGVKWSQIIGEEPGPFDPLSPRPGKDNCPSIPNDQVNTDLDSATQLGGGDRMGDACDNDDDQDSIVDQAEVYYKWDTTNNECSDDFTVPPSGVLDPLKADSDGDGILDGIECDMASNPANSSSVPVSCSVGYLVSPRPDLDSDLLCGTALPALGVDDEEVNWRTDGISGASTLDPDGDTLVGDNDPDSDELAAAAGLSDACEVLIAGTSPMAPDTDEDTVLDKDEVVGASAGAPGNAACSAPTLQYGEIGNGTGVTLADTSVPNASGGRTADTDMDGLLNYLDADPGGDITYDDNNDGAMMSTGTPDDDGPSWDVNADGILDGWLISCGSATLDADGDGLKDAWENCKWGTNPSIVDSDNDGIGDCTEAVDTNGNNIILGDFGGDGLNSARATLLPAGVGTGKFGKDGDFDLNGNMLVAGDFGADTLTTARMTLGIWTCK